MSTDPTLALIGDDQGGTQFFLIRNNSTYGFFLHLCGRKTDNTKHAYFIRQGLIINNGGATSLIGPVTTVGTDNNIPGWALTISADDTNDCLSVSIVAEDRVRWFGTLDFTEVSTL